MYTGMNDFCAGNSLMKTTPILLICAIALSCSEPSPPGVGVYLKNPGEQYVSLLGYSLSELKADEMEEYPQGMPKLHPGGMIVLYKEPHDSFGTYLGTKFHFVYDGTREPDAATPARKVDDETYVWDSEMLKGKVCAGLWYILKLKETTDDSTRIRDSKVWFFCYDDQSGVLGFLGQWGQAGDYLLKPGFSYNGSRVTSGPLVTITMDDCKLNVSTKVFARFPADFSDGQIVATSPPGLFDSTTFALTMDRATGELVAPNGIPWVEGNGIRLSRFVEDAATRQEDAVTRQAQLEMQEAQRRRQAEAAKHQ
jgi:hypothetical protein